MEIVLDGCVQGAGVCATVLGGHTMLRPRLTVQYIDRCLDLPKRRVRRRGGIVRANRMISKALIIALFSAYVEVLAFAVEQHI